VTSDLSQVFESVEKLIYWYMKVKEGKAFDYQMYPAIFKDLSIWQECASLGGQESTTIYGIHLALYQAQIYDSESILKHDFS